MNLVEEYYARHRLGAPLVQRPEARSVVICRQQKTDDNRLGLGIFSIDRESPGTAPAYYMFRWMQPMYNTGSGGNMINHRSPKDRKVEWDSYDAEIVNLAARPDFCPLADQDDISIAMWEMLLYSSDSLLISLPYEVQRHLWRSIDLDLSVKERVEAQKQCMNELSIGRHSLASRWKHLQDYIEVRVYANWLAKLSLDIKSSNFQAAELIGQLT